MKKVEKHLLKAKTRLERIQKKTLKIKKNPYARLQQAYDQGKTIQVFKTTWHDIIGQPKFTKIPNFYRVKPDTCIPVLNASDMVRVFNNLKRIEPKTGDICKFWDDDSSDFRVATLKRISIDNVYPYCDNKNETYTNCQPLDPSMTLGEVFGRKESDEL